MDTKHLLFRIVHLAYLKPAFLFIIPSQLYWEKIVVHTFQANLIVYVREHENV